MTLAAIVIGRNEGKRLVRCIQSLQGQVDKIIYVDSGSTDGSVKAAQDLGAITIDLDMSVPFTAARARNAGLSNLSASEEFVQVIDGDCELHSQWLGGAVEFLKSHPDIAMVAGRLHERFPQKTIWNKLADAEWNTAVGDTDAVGGIALLRKSAIDAAGGYRSDMIAGEEPELCLRLRRQGWKIHRLAQDMAWHDIEMTRISQWWKRCRRGGHAFAEGAALHGRGPERYRVREVRRSLFWGLGIPLMAVLGSFFTVWSLVILLAWPLQVLRLKRTGLSWVHSFFLTLSKIPEAQGIVGFWMSGLRGRRRRLIEYK